MSSWTEYKKRKKEAQDGGAPTTVSSWQQYKAKKQQEAEASGEVSYNTWLSQHLQTRAITDAVNRQYVAYHAEANRARTYAENRQKREAEREASQIASRIDNSIQRGGQLDLPTLRYRIDELDRNLMDPSSGYNQSIPASALRTEADYLKSIRQDIMENARAEWDEAETARNEARDSNRYASAAQKAQEAKAQWQYLYATLQGGDLDQAEREYNDAVQKARNYFGVDLEYQAQLEDDAREKQLIYESIRDYRSSAEVDQAKARKDAAQREYERLFAEITSMDVAGTLTPEMESSLKAAKDRVKKADDEYNRLYNEYFGASSPARYAGTTIGRGLASILNRATATVAFINQYNPLIPEYNKQSSFAAHNKTTDWLNSINYEAGRAATAMGPSGGWQWASDAGASIVEQIPYMILAVATGGGSAAAGAASSAGKKGVVNAIKNAVLAMAKDPTTYLTAFMTMGTSYEQAINAGASDFQAASFGVVDGLVASVIERGLGDDASGIQGIPRMVKEAAETGNNAFLKELMKGFLDEGKEEILQDVISGLASYGIYGYDTGMKFASVEDEEAALNPVRALESGFMGAVVGGFGGAFTGAGASVDAWLRNNAPATVEQYSREADAVFQTEGGLKAFVDYGLKADPDTELFQRANAMMSLSADQVTDKEVSALYRAVLADMDAKTQAEAEVTAEDLRAMSAAQEVAENLARTPEETANRYDLKATRDEVIENLSGLGIDEKFASELADTYQLDTNINPTDFSLDVEAAYRAGRADAPLNALDGQRISPDVQAKAYEAGRQAAGQRPTILRSNAGKGRVVMQIRHSLTERQETSVAALKKISQALGVNFYVFESELGEDGQRVGDNGYYDRDGIHIDIHAGANGDGLMLFTAAHELTHFIKDQAPVEFKKLAEFLFDNYKAADISVDELINRQIEKASAQGRSISYDIAYEEVVADSMETMLADGNVVERLADLKTKDRGLWEKIRDFFNKLAERIRKVYEGVSPDSVEGYYVSQMVDSIDQIQNLFTEGLAAAGENYQSNTVEIDTSTKSVAPLSSLRTWTASEYVQEREKSAKSIVSALGVDIQTAYRYIDSINSVARLVSEDQVRLDYDSNMDPDATVLKSNQEYKYSVDMSTLCAKRLLFTGTFDAIQKALPNYVFTSEDIVGLREMMQKKGYEVACGICYVESTRREIGRITQEFIDRYKEAQKSGNPVTRINSKGEEVELTNQRRVFYADPEYTPTLGDLNTTSIDEVKRDHREVYDAYLAFMNARGQAKPKLLETRAEYKGEILSSFRAKSAVKARNDSGGLRLQSFSDFEIPHLIDMMQVVIDMSRVGLKSQAYTKVPAFAEAFGNTGIKINLSLIAKGNGLDANGNLVFDDVEGIDHEKAFDLRSRFSDNVGTILVGKNDAHIIAALADPRIDFVIPFHKSSWKESLYKSLGLTGYEDYTEYQNEKPLDKSRKIRNFDPSEYWDFTKSGDENAQIYLEKCMEDGRRPKFPQFQSYPGYWKLLIDFKMYNNEGVGAPQQVVQPVFDDSVTERLLAEYRGGHRSFPVAQDIVDEFLAAYSNLSESAETRQSSRETESLSNRTLLANALMSVAKTDEEARLLQEYKDNVAKMEELDETLSTAKARLKEVMFAKGPRDTGTIATLNAEIKKATNRLNAYDRALIKLETAAPLRKLIARERDVAIRRVRESYQEARAKNVEGRKRTLLRGRIQRTVKKLNDLLVHGTKEKHVPTNLRRPVAAALAAFDAFDMDRLESNLSDAELAYEMETDPVVAVKMEKSIARQTRFIENLESLQAEYAKLLTSADPEIKGAHDDGVATQIQNVLMDVDSDATIYDLDSVHLESIYKLYRALYKTVTEANRVFFEGKKENYRNLGREVVEQTETINGRKAYGSANPVVDWVKKFDVNNKPPIYVMRMIGSKTFQKLFMGLFNAQGTWGRDIVDANRFLRDKSAQYGFKDWDLSETIDTVFKDANGEEFRLTLGQAMSLYAYSRRDYAKKHLRLGGFVYKDGTILTVDGKKEKPNTVDNFIVDDAVMEQIRKTLSEQQASFVEDMQTYLSKVMGSKGNEVSTDMYDIELFGEENYFPMRVTSQQREENYDESKNSVVSLKNMGFTRKPAPNASSSLVIDDFLDVWSSHVVQMSNYHAFVVPLEAFTKVYNYEEHGAGQRATGVRQSLISTFGGNSVADYVSDFIRDVNGGARSDPRESPYKYFLSLQKKAATMASFSVLVQQPSSLPRAFAHVDMKYFFRMSNGVKRGNWDEVKRYSPVAVIKDMGRFDTGTGKATTDYVKNVDETLLDKVSTRQGWEDILGAAPAKADELSWVVLWNAVKNEVAETTTLKPNTEEFLRAAGDRYGEVIALTQVYDSVFSKSANMRSKSAVMQTLTTYMGEPTLVQAMVSDAILQARRGNVKQASKSMAAVMTSLVLNALMVALPYALRDKDEDESFMEKYVEAAAGSLADGLMPANYYPILRDIWSIVEGWDVQRADMALIDDLVTAIRGMTNEETPVDQKIINLAGSIANLFGVPLKNIYRDLRSAYDLIINRRGLLPTTNTGIRQALLNAIPLRPEDSKGSKMYSGLMRGDKTYAQRIASTYKTESAANTALQSALRTNDPRIKQAAQAYVDGNLMEYDRIVEEIAGEGHFDRNRIIGAVQSEITDLEPETYGPELYVEKVKGKYSAADYLEALSNNNNYDDNYKDIVRRDIIDTYVANGKTEEEAEKALLDGLKSAVKDRYTGGMVTAKQAEKLLTQHADMDADEAYWQVKKWKDGSSSNYNSLRDSLWSGKGIDAAVKELTDHGYTAENVQAQVRESLRDMFWGEYEGNKNRLSRSNVTDRLTRYGGYTREEADQLINEWTSYVQTGIKYSEIKSLYMEGKITASRAKQIYTKYGGLTKEEAEDKIQEFDFQKKYPDLELSAAGIRKYNQYAQPQGVSAEEFYDLWSYEKLSDTYQEDVIEYIDSLSLSSSQKDALFVCFYAQSSLYKCPW